jgi:hypothetical protein
MATRELIFGGVWTMDIDALVRCCFLIPGLDRLMKKILVAPHLQPRIEFSFPAHSLVARNAEPSIPISVLQIVSSCDIVFLLSHFNHLHKIML